MLPLLLGIASIGAAAEPAPAFNAFTLEQLRRIALDENPGVRAAREAIAASRAQVVTASAYPNPEVDLWSGERRARLPELRSGAVGSYALTQRIDYPWQRRARIAAAEYGIVSAQAQAREFEVDLLATLGLRFFDVLRRESELRAAEEDLALAEAIRSKVAVRVDTGEAPRYELIRADAEWLNTQKNAQAAELRIAQAKSALRTLVSPSLPENFRIEGDLDEVASLPPLATLRDQLLKNNPELERGRAEIQRAGKQLDVERLRRTPELALRVARYYEPDYNSNSIGAIVTIPLWDRRPGPIAEAGAELRRRGAEQEGRVFSLLRDLEGAYHRYEIADTQVSALESGIVREAEAALRVAEAGYRLGERGILDYLDAQRAFRAARNELITARYELQVAAIEIERMRAEFLTTPDQAAPQPPTPYGYPR